jgi:hypothetical protein
MASKVRGGVGGGKRGVRTLVAATRLAHGDVPEQSASLASATQNLAAAAAQEADAAALREVGQTPVPPAGLALAGDAASVPLAAGAAAPDTVVPAPTLAAPSPTAAGWFQPIYLAPLSLLSVLAGGGGGGGSSGAAQSAAAAVTDARKISLARITAYADDNGAVSVPPSVQDYAAAGVTGVTAENVSAINSALAANSVMGPQVDSSAELQVLVDAFNKILAEANGPAPDATADDPTLNDFSAVGVVVGKAATIPAALSLLNDVIGLQPASGVTTVSDIDTFAVAVDKMMNAVLGARPAPTVAEFGALGVVGVTDKSLPVLLAAIARAPDDGSSVASLVQLQGLADQAAIDGDKPSPGLPVPSPAVTITGIQDDIWSPGTAVPRGGASADTSPVLTGSFSAALGANQAVVVYRDGVKLGSASLLNASGWTYTDAAVPLGAHSYTARVEDAAGQAGVAAAAYLFTEIAPSLEAADLLATSDTGNSRTDNLTADTTPTFSGRVVGAIRSITLWDDANSNDRIDPGETIVAAHAPVVGGVWNITAATPLAEGIYRIRAAATDGNNFTGPVSAVLGSSPDFLHISASDTRVNTLVGVSSLDYLGRDLTSIGDFNGDGYEDFAVMASGADAAAGRVDAGKTYVLYGGARGIDNTVNLAQTGAASAGKLLEISGAALGDGGNYQSAALVSRAGDVNGDGLDDLLIAAMVANAPNGVDGGAVYVVYGSRSAYTSGRFDLNTIASGNTSQGVRITSPASDGLTSYALGLGAGAGDLNQDGYADMVVGAPHADPGTPPRPDAGAAFVVYGGNALTNTAVSTTNPSASGFAVWGASGASFSAPTTLANDSNLGENAAAVGDVNGDGIIDFVVSSPYANNYLASQAGAGGGTAYLIYGVAGARPSLDLNNFTAADGIRVHGPRLEGLGGSHSFSGHWVRGLGDINGDGVADWAIAAPDAEPEHAGHVWVLYGQRGAYAHDINLDFQVPYPLPAGLVPALDFNAQTGFLIVNEHFTHGSNTNAHSGSLGDALSLGPSAIGDVNLDGIDDILVGTRPAYGPSANVGASYIVYGRAGGMGSNLVELADIVANPNLGYVLRGSDAFGAFGLGLVAGDWNGDGIPDFAGARPLAATDGLIYNGAVLLWNGDSALATQPFTEADDTIIATASADRILGGAGNDNITALGLGDVAMGGQGNDRFTITSSNFTRIDGGLGQDSLVLAGSGMALDAAQLGTRLQHIETIDLGQAGNTLSLRLADALYLTDTPSQALTIQGDGAQLILHSDLSGSWFAASTSAVSGQAYTIYHHAALPSANSLGDIAVQQGVDILLQGQSGSDRFLVAGTVYPRIDGGLGLDTIEFGAAASINGNTLVGKISNIETLSLGSGDQAVILSASNIAALSSSTDTLTITSNALGDTLDLVEIIGTGANAWHLLGASGGIATYQYFDAGNNASSIELLVAQTVNVF